MGMANEQVHEPSFQCFRGGYGGYSQKTDRVSKKNLKALMREMVATDFMYERASELEWVEVWRTINDFQEWWWNYYAGQKCVVESTYPPMQHWASDHQGPSSPIRQSDASKRLEFPGDA